MTLNLPQFYRASNPSKPLDLGKAEDRKYYIDFSSVLGTSVRQKLERTITCISPHEPTFQLFTGHIGCGKTTQLLQLKHELEQQGYHVLYFESSQDIDMGDVDIVDILLSIASQLTESLESIKIRLKPGYFAKLLQESIEFLTIPIELGSEAELSFHMGRITAKTKESPKLRRQLREYLRPLTENILEAINEEIFGAAIKELRLRGKEGLVIIIDNLDRVSIRPLPSGRSQVEYLFIDRGEYFKRLKCHIVCTVPLALIFSNEVETLKNRLGGGISPSVLPMVPLKLRDGSDCAEGINLLRQMVLVRAFPDLAPEQRIDLVTEIFDSPETLERLCRISGGHVRNLLGILFNCLRQENPPISRETLEGVIRESRNYLTSSIDDDEWKLLRQVVETQRVRGEQEYQTLLRSMYVFEYRDSQGSWFDINPVLAEVLAEVIEAKAKQQELVDKALAKVQEFFRQTGATTRQEENVLQITSVPGRLKSYTPLAVMFAEQPVDRNVTELIQYSAQLTRNSQYKVSILLYRNPPDTSARLQMAQVRARDHFVLIPIPFAAVEQALTDEATSIGLLAQYTERYLPGADLFDDRNAIGDTLCFFGRGNLLHSLEEDLRRIQGIGLFGLRKSGKTSLLLQLGFAMRQHPVVHIDLEPYGGKLRYGSELFNRILQKLSQLIKQRTPSPTPDSELFDRDCPAADLTTDFARWVGDFAKTLGKAGYQLPILLFLDEIERILPTKEDSRERVEEFNAFFGVLRALSQEQKLISLLIADVHPDANRINHWSQAGVPTNPVSSFFKEVFVYPFSQEETTEMLTEIGKLMGVGFDEETLVAIHRESGGHPFIARQMARLLCKKAEKEKSDNCELIKSSAAQRYLNKPFKHSGVLKDYFEKSIWEELQKRNFASAMAVLQLLACNEESAEAITEETLLEQLSHDFSESECTDALLWLEAVGLVVREELEDDDSYRIQVLLMSRWLRMQMKPEEIRQWQLKKETAHLITLD